MQTPSPADAKHPAGPHSEPRPTKPHSELARIDRGARNLTKKAEQRAWECPDTLVDQEEGSARLGPRVKQQGRSF